MDATLLKGLAQKTLWTPREAAQEIMSWQLSRDVLWTALALVAVANTFLALLLSQISGPSAMPLPGYFDAPLALFVLIAGLMVVYIHGMYWSGLAMGGKGTLMDVLALVVWFQALRAAAQVAVIVLTLAIPAFGMLLSLVVAGWGLWIFLNFLATALKLPTLWHSFGVLLLAAVGMLLGLGLLLGLVGIGV